MKITYEDLTVGELIGLLSEKYCNHVKVGFYVKDTGKLKKFTIREKRKKACDETNWKPEDSIDIILEK